MKKFKISVIIPIYNVEEYLEETILSVVNQTIGFENIQMILVNDGSPDNSESICLKYKEMYPENVIYIKQENSGVSAARNNGLKYATGEFINFLDSDDKYSLNAYQKGYEMFECNSQLNLCCFRMKIFDAESRFHSLDYRFDKGDRIIDLTKEPYNPVYHVTSIIFRRKVLKNILFDTQLKISEDFKFICDVVNKSHFMGLIKSELFYYRRRKTETSAIQTASSKLTYFIDTPKYCYEYVMKLSKKNKKLKKYFEHCVIYDLQYRLSNVNLMILSDEQKQEYISSIRKLLLDASDEIICNQKVLNKAKIFRALSFKYGKPICNDLKIKNSKIFFKNYEIMNINEINLKVYKFEVESNKLVISALNDMVENNDFELYLKTNKGYKKFNKSLYSTGERFLSDIDFETKRSFFDIELEIDEISFVEFYLEIKGKKYKFTPIFEKFSKINNLSNSYYKKMGIVFTRNGDKVLINKRSLFYRLKYLFELLNKEKDFISFCFIILYYLTYPFIKNDIWLVSDRYDLAGDNGEDFFKYLNSIDKKNVYFCISKNSRDVKRLKSIGKIIYFGSIKYYLYYMHSQFVISSQCDNYIHKPFGKKQFNMNHLINTKFVFLQHGVLDFNLAKRFRRYEKNFSLFVTSTKKEYDKVLSYDYMYGKDVVKLTGMSRFDSLANSNSNERLILICPSWRLLDIGKNLNLAKSYPYKENFKNTEFYKFWHSLINDVDLINNLKKHKYKIVFCLHPILKKQIVDFKSDCSAISIQTLVNYKELIKRASLLVTDYSSISYDFAYLNKPIIYAQFDKNKIIYTHYYSDCMPLDYEKEGFGKVVYDFDSLKRELINFIIKKGSFSKKYEKNAKNVFIYLDKNNSKRIYEEIIKLV